MKLFLIVVFLVVMQSCTNAPQQKEPFKSLLSKCDEVTINFYNGGDTIHFQTVDSLGIKYLSENISGNTETISDTCQPVGSLYYRAKGDTLLKAEFAVLPTADKKQCAYLSYNYQNTSYKNKLSEKIYQLLKQMYPKPAAMDTTTQAIDSTEPTSDSPNKKADSIKK